MRNSQIIFTKFIQATHELAARNNCRTQNYPPQKSVIMTAPASGAWDDNQGSMPADRTIDRGIPADKLPGQSAAAAGPRPHCNAL